MTLTSEEKEFLVNLLSQLTFKVDGLAQGQLTKNILEKLNSAVEGEIVA